MTVSPRAVEPEVLNESSVVDHGPAAGAQNAAEPVEQVKLNVCSQSLTSTKTATTSTCTYTSSTRSQVQLY